MRKFAVFDIDGTLIRWQLYHAIADGLAKRGYIESSAFQDIKDARMEWKRRAHPEAFKTYEEQLVHLYNQMLRELKVKHLEEVINSVFDEYKDQVYVYTRDLIKQLKNDRYLLFAISGSQTEIVEKIARYYGFDDWVGSNFVQVDGQFTGELVAALGKKEIVLKEIVKKHRAVMDGSIGVGDSAGDIKMLEAVEQPVAFNPEQKLFVYAQERGWKIVIERKNMVYELESKDGKYQLVKTNTR